MRPGLFLSGPLIAVVALGATVWRREGAPHRRCEERQSRGGSGADSAEDGRQRARARSDDGLALGRSGGDVQTVALLIRAGAKVNAANRFGVTPMSLAARGNGDARLVEALLAAGVDPNSTSPEGETILMTASRSGSAEAVQVLLAHGASVNLKEGWHEQTALMWAAADNQPAIVKALLAAGAEVNRRAKVLPEAPVGRGRGSETSSNPLTARSRAAASRRCCSPPGKEASRRRGCSSTRVPM